MHYLTIVLRLLHVVAGAFWFGTSMMVTFMITPAIAVTGEAGQKFMAALVQKANLTKRIAAAGGLTVLAGLGLYWIDSSSFTSAWAKSGVGMMFGIGGFFGLIGLVLGIVVGRDVNTIVKTGSEIQGKPTAEQLSKIQAAQKRLSMVGPISSYALIIAMICMSVARYWF